MLSFFYRLRNWFLKIPKAVFTNPSRQAIVTWAVFLLCLMITLVAIFKDRGGDPTVQEITSWSCLLTPIACAIAYGAAVLWFDPVAHRFPDIYSIWREGLSEIRRKRFDFERTPLFLIVGMSEMEECERLMNAAGESMRFEIRGLGGPKEPLSWYATDNAIYLFLRNVSRISQDNAQTDKGDGYLQTGHDETITGYVGLDEKSARIQTNRLEYLCELLLNERRFRCSINGVLCAVPVEALAMPNSEGRIENMRRHIKLDVDTLRRNLHMRFPVSFLLTGFESEQGFVQLAGRIGIRSQNSRMGKGYPLWIIPREEHLKNLVEIGCRSFEHDAVKEFAKLKEPINTLNIRNIYGMVCKIRHRVEPRLRQLVIGAFAETARGMDGRDSLCFGGCYFGAIGQHDYDQLFIRGVIDKKLRDQEGEICWDSAAAKSDHMYHLIASVMTFVSVMLVAVFIFVVTANNNLGIDRWFSE